MLKSITKIQNVNLFKNYEDQDNKVTFKKLTLIFGQNGSGKSTIATILSSLSWWCSDTTLDELRSAFSGSSEPTYISFLDTNDNKYEYCVEEQEIDRRSAALEPNLVRILRRYAQRTDRAGNVQGCEMTTVPPLCNIEVFDDNFVKFGSKSIGYVRNGRVLYPSREIENEIDSLIHKQHRILDDFTSNRRRNAFMKAVRRTHVRQGTHVIQLDKQAINGYRTTHKRILKLLKEKLKRIQKLNGKYTNIVNSYLRDFGSILEISKIRNGPSTKIDRYARPYEPTEYDTLQNSCNYLMYDIKLGNVELDTVPIKLSESQRRVLALSFFLANLELDKACSQKIVIFDDAYTSFDSDRKFTTLSILKNLIINKKVMQLIVLSHDEDFLHELATDAERKRIPTSKLKIELSFNEDTAKIIQMDTTAAYEQQLNYLREYQKNPVSTQDEKRLVLLYARLVLETKLKEKYASKFGRYGLHSKMMFGQLIRTLQQKNFKFQDKHTNTVCDDLFRISNETSPHLHGTNLPIPGSLSNDDLEVWNKNDLKGLVDRTIEFIDNRI